MIDDVVISSFRIRPGPPYIQYYIQSYGAGTQCSGTPSTSTNTYYACISSSVYLGSLGDEYDAYGYVTSQCLNGPSAPPTAAPSGPTPAPTVAPTVGPATGFVSISTYTTEACSDVPNFVTVYSLGVCFQYGSNYSSYSIGSASPSGYVTLIFTKYQYSSCTSLVSSNSCNLATTCSSGSIATYSPTAPIVPLSISTR